MFVKLCEKAIGVLPALLEHRLFNATLIYNVTQLYLRNRLSSNVSTEFYAYNEEIDSCHEQTAFIVTVQRSKSVSETQVMLSAPLAPTRKMIQALQTVLNWNVPHSFPALDMASSGFVMDLCVNNNNPVTTIKCHNYAMSVDDGLKIKMNESLLLTESLYCRELLPDQAEIVNDQWPRGFKPPGTRFILDSIANIGGSVGIHRKNDDHLVSWVIPDFLGSISGMHTMPEYRGKGLSDYALKRMSYNCAKMGLLPNGQVKLDNGPSIRLMSRIGWTYSHEIDWLEYKKQPLLKNKN